MKLFDEKFLSRLEGLRLAVRRPVRGPREGERPSARRGGSAEFVSHRSYTPGDSFRAIDWHLYARLGKLFVKESAREESLTLHLVFDTSRSMDVGTPSKLDLARRLAAGLCAAASPESGPVVLWSRSGRRDLPCAGTLSAGLLAALEGVSMDDTTPQTVLKFARRAKNERGVLIFFSDLWDGSLREPLLGARAAGDVAVIHLLTPAEMEPGWSGRVQMEDSESGERVERFVGDEERARYGELLREYCEEWKGWCRDHEINYVRCASDASWDEVVRTTLREAGILE